MIYITGDTHIPIDIKKLSTENFPEGKTLSKRDFVIICGDFGGVWDNSAEELYWRKWLNEKPWTTLFLDGNHENHPELAKFEEMKFCGGQAHKISDSIYHLMRGYVFEIDGKKIFVMGGATSTDKEYRIPGRSWWPEEIPSDKEFERGFNNLIKENNKVDIVLSHAAPDDILKMIDPYYEHDKVTNFLNIVRHDVDFADWYFGHYHIDKDFGKYHALYNTIAKL